MSRCQDTGTHHSTDTVRVFVGRPRPVTLCGFHAHAGMDVTRWTEAAGYAACDARREVYMDGPTMVLSCSRRDGHDGSHRATDGSAWAVSA